MINLNKNLLNIKRKKISFFKTNELLNILQNK